MRSVEHYIKTDMLLYGGMFPTERGTVGFSGFATSMQLQEPMFVVPSRIFIGNTVEAPYSQYNCSTMYLKYT